MNEGTVAEPIDPMAHARIFAQRSGFVFQDPSLFVQAVTHASAREMGLQHNERLEFLGDAILGMVVCEFLYRKFPDLQEGDLSQFKSILVSAKYLTRVARRLGLEDLVLRGKGMTARRLPVSILADAVEAVIAAIYLDAGLEPARAFVTRFVIEPHILEVATQRGERNYKSMLQDFAQKNNHPLPKYHLTRTVGPDHKKRFQVQVEFLGRLFEPQWGDTKKDSEQAAARAAMVALGELKE